MLSVTRYRPEDPSRFLTLASDVLQTLAAKPGFLHGRLGQNLDDPGGYQLVLEFDSVGSYRRAWSDPATRMIVLPLLLTCLDEPSVFADVLTAVPGSAVESHHSGLSDGWEQGRGIESG